MIDVYQPVYNYSILIDAEHVPPAKSEHTSQGYSATTLDPLMHIKDMVRGFQAHNYREKDRSAILGILDICSRTKPDLYVSPNNAFAVYTLLSNVTTCFDTSRSDTRRYRQCNILLGMKNTGKTLLASTLQKAIQEQYPRSITMTVDSSVLRGKTVVELVKSKCKKDGIDVEGTELQDILDWLAKDKRSLLLVVDEAQDMYPRTNDPRGMEAYEHTVALVNELHVLAQQPGCVCWLIGSSHALHHLAFGGAYPDYYGIYRDLNDKKYTPLYYLALRDPQSIQEFLRADTATIVPLDQIAQMYERYGGAMGDLVQRKPLSRSFIAPWDKPAQAILLALVLAQPTTSECKPWNLVPIQGDTARNVIGHIQPDCSADIELKRLCDMYLLERDNIDCYHLAHHDAIRHCAPSGGHMLNDCYDNATVPLPSHSSYLPYSPLFLGIHIYAIVEMPCRRRHFGLSEGVVARHAQHTV